MSHGLSYWAFINSNIGAHLKRPLAVSNPHSGHDHATCGLCQPRHQLCDVDTHYCDRTTPKHSAFRARLMEIGIETISWISKNQQ
jgi:hypothetical protein